MDMKRDLVDRIKDYEGRALDHLGSDKPDPRVAKVLMDHAAKLQKELSVFMKLSGAIGKTADTNTEGISVEDLLSD